MQSSTTGLDPLQDLCLDYSECRLKVKKKNQYGLITQSAYEIDQTAFIAHVVVRSFGKNRQSILTTGSERFVLSILFDLEI